jgi:hypothetical protein
MARGEPLVVNDVHHVMQGNWNPTYFVLRYGSQEVTITDCKSNEEYSSTVAQFFSAFGTQSRTDKRVLKLKALLPFCASYSSFNLCIGLASAGQPQECLSRVVCGVS